MKFVPVPITGGPTNGQRVLFSVWETRVQDYEVFAKETKREWPKVEFEQGPTHPAVNVSWDDAQAFCAWLNERERKAGTLGASDTYRLPSDHEWSCAVGLGRREDAAAAPISKSGTIAVPYPWGNQWPPSQRVGNFADKAAKEKNVKGKTGYLESYDDGYPWTSPVGSFPGDVFGLFVLLGNAREWCENGPGDGRASRVSRGASWFTGGELQISYRSVDADTHTNVVGFRVVLAPAL